MNLKLFITISISFLFLLITTSCEKVNTKHETKQNQELKEQLEKTNSEIEKLMLAGNYDALMQFYTEDIVISPALHPSVKGINALKENYEKDKEIGVKYHSFSGNPEEIWECSKFVYERGDFGLAVSSNNHPKPVAYYGSYFTIWQKENDGSLKIKYVIWNLNFNPCED